MFKAVSFTEERFKEPEGTRHGGTRSELITQTFRKWRQDDLKFKVSLDHVAKFCFKLKCMEAINKIHTMVKGRALQRYGMKVEQRNMLKKIQPNF